jgi:HlyD family secretion protein
MKTVAIIVVSLVVAAGTLGGLAVWFSRGASGGGGGSTVASGRMSLTPGITAGGITVRVSPVATSTLVETVNAPGEVQAKTKVAISARVSARIAELPFKEGDTVTKGDPNANPPIPPSLLVKLDSKELAAQVRSVQARYNSQAAERKVSDARIRASEASLGAAKITLADNERSLRRTKALYESRDVSQQEVEADQAKWDSQKATVTSMEEQLDADRANLKVLEYTLDAAKAEVERAEENLSYSEITSPIDGTITKIDSEVGELAVVGTLNAAGTQVMEVADLSKMMLLARIDETSITHVKVGQKAKVRVQAYAPEVFDGVVESVALARAGMRERMNQSQTSQIQGNYFETKILLDTKGQQILSGLTADVDIETAHHEGVMTVPSQAVLGREVDSLAPGVRWRPEVDPNKTIATVVYRVENNKAVAVPVKVGPSDINNTIILSGLKAGDQVITGPYKILETLAEGQMVKVEAVASATQPASTQATSRPAASAK